MSPFKQEDQHVAGSGLEDGDGGDGGDGGDDGGEDPTGLEPVVTLYLMVISVELSEDSLTDLTSQLAAGLTLPHSRRRSVRPPG